MSVTVSVDCMGGDHGPSVTVPAVLAFLRKHEGVGVILVGREEALTPLLGKAHAEFGARLSIQNATQVVEMDEEPKKAIRFKKDSSMRVAINLVHEGRAQAVVSAGNTGALLAIARFVLKTLPGIDRPALCFALPTVKGHAYALDLGANVDCTPQHLLQFAVMGSALASAIDHSERPTVGLLNVGSEDIKGNDLTKRAAELLRAGDVNFHGNVEGDDIFKGTTSVVVCDGFAGNVAIKSTEGLAKMLSTFLREEIKRSPLSLLMGLIASPVLKRFKQRSDPNVYNGAVLLGLRGVVVKSHGGASAFAFECALARAAEAASNRLIERITDKMVPAKVITEMAGGNG